MISLLQQQWLQIISSSWLVGLSIAGFAVGLWVYRRGGGNALLHPLLIGAPIIAGILYMNGLGFEVYYEGNGALSWLLGPTTVALAVPLSQQLRKLPAVLGTLSLTVLMGGFVASVFALSLAVLLGTSEPVLLSIAAKSVTTPIAMGITQQLGGLLTLITMVVLLTGIIGIIVAQAIFALTGIVDERWQGLILGIACHAIGTAKAFEKSQRCGAFSTIGMGLNGIWSSAFLPSLIGLFLA